MSETRTAPQLYFEDTQVGDVIASRDYGPLTIVDTVRWAGFQENSERIHWDREFAREHSRLRTFIASGSYRQALLVRIVTDRIGAGGVLKRLSVRHTYPTYENDMMRFQATVVEKSSNAADPWVVCDIEGQNQESRTIMTGTCTIVLPSRGIH